VHVEDGIVPKALVIESIQPRISEENGIMHLNNDYFAV
jgi:hypothetical protein